MVLSSEEHLQAAGLIQSDAPNWGFVKKKSKANVSKGIIVLT